MSIGKVKSKTYLNIKEGRIIARNKDGKEEAYDYVEGYLMAIYTRDREFKGETVKYWYIDIEDKAGNAYSLALHYGSGVAKSIFNSLASLDNTLEEIKIQPYQSGEFTKVIVYSGGKKLNWKYPELPEVKEVKVGEKVVKDDSERMLFFENIVKEINKVI